MNDRLDPFDELAALFLTEPEGSTTPPTATAPREATIEIIEVGSLPVRAALWLPPYADQVAAGVGPVALLRLDLDAPVLQLFRAPPALRARRWVSLRDAMAELQGQITHWVVRPPLQSGAAAAVAAGADRITILSSANDSARVDAYQRAKALVEAAESAGLQVPAVQLAVLGSDTAAAELMQERLSTTTSSFLSIQVPLAMAVPRIDAVMGASDPMDFPNDPVPSLAAVLSSIRAPVAPRMAAPPPPPPPTAAPAPSQAAAPRRPAAQRRVVEAPPELVGAPAKLPPKPAVEVEPKDPGDALEPSELGRPVPLARFIEGVTDLEIRPPGHERVEIGVDAAGTLHVISREADMRSLHNVAAWARAHREILERACPGHAIDPAGRTVLHVFTDRPATLADLHGCELRLHVLAPVDVHGRRGWYAAPLNG